MIDWTDELHERIDGLDRMDCYESGYEDAKAHYEAAEADKARLSARVAELEEALIHYAITEKIYNRRPVWVCDICDASDDERDLVEHKTFCALSGDGSRILADVVYRHRKGGLYRIVARGLLESDLTPVVVYRALTGGECWVRPTAEFQDGRFTVLDPLDGDGDAIQTG